MDQISVGVIGAGSWGTAISLLLAENGHEVDLWVYETDLLKILKEKSENEMFLPGFKLPNTIQPTNSLEEAVVDKDIVFLVSPTHSIRNVVEKFAIFLKPGCLVVNASKGIEIDTLLTVDQILESILPTHCLRGCISGPTFAKEIAQKVPSAIVAAAHDLETAERIQNLLSNNRLKAFTSQDVLGVEIGGALKNVIAIGTGIADGLGLGYNARAALITRGLVEITRIGCALGAKQETFSGLSGMGDLVLTCTGDLSRNRTVGLQIGQGKSLGEITQNMKTVAEGLHTVKSAYRLKEKLQVQASIIEETYHVLYDDKPPLEALNDLMKVDISHEFEGVAGIK
jgi:glycerol-3-phosphate dehydrogenase (NAD(P)+)